MDGFLAFLRKHIHRVIFIILLGIGFYWIIKTNPHQGSLWTIIALSWSGEKDQMYAQWRTLLLSKEQNDSLIVVNGDLNRQIEQLQKQVTMLRCDTLAFVYDTLLPPPDYLSIPALVVQNELHGNNNHIILDKGALDGVCPEMGVVDQNGLVGIVTAVSDHFCLVISLLNPKVRFSCKIKGSDFVGSLVWDEKSTEYAMLESIPRNVVFQKGDEVITSGQSMIFPPNIRVGTVVEHYKQKDDNFYNILVKLSTRFRGLNKVRILQYQYTEERSQLYSSISKE